MESHSNMNRALLDPFGVDFPTEIVHRLIHEDAITTISCVFNRRGNYLASGTRDGKCFIWDLDTHSVAHVFKPHAGPIISLTFSRRGQHLLTASKDWSLVIWDLQKRRRIHTVRFGSPLIEAALHPRNKRIALVIAQGDPPYMIIFGKEENEFTKQTLALKHDKQDARFAVCVAFTPDGKYALVGSTKGSVHVFDVKDGTPLNVLDVGGSISVRNIKFTKSGKELLINGSDRSLRSYGVSFDENGMSWELKNKFMDVINRLQWTQCCFSADEEYVVGTCESGQKHSLYVYIWDKNTGVLVKMLEGPREGLADMAWHPIKPSFVTISHFGTIYVWGVHYTQNFSAFAPSFTELNDNVDYEEREDEFDVNAASLQDKDKKEEQNDIVDITTRDFKVVSDTEDETNDGNASDFEELQSKSPFYLALDL